MINEIYIQNKRLDVSSEISSLITYALDDIKDFAARNTAYSKTIVLPGTANNNYLFGNIFDVRVSNSFNASGENVATNFNPAIAADCLIFQNHIQVFKGTMRVLEIIIDKGVPEYEVSVVGELGGLINEIGTGKLEDLDFSAYNHTYNVANIIASWAATPGTGYFYPLIDYGGVSTNKKDYDIKALRTAFYVREYIDKIITGAGYTWSSDLLNTTRFKKLVVPYNTKNFQRNSYILIYGTRYTGAEVINAGTGSPINVPFLYYPMYLFTGGPETFTYAGASNLNTRAVPNFYGTYIANTIGFTVKLYHNGVAVSAFTETLPSNGDDNLRYFNLTTPVDLIIAPGDTLVLKAESTGGSPAGADMLTLTGYFKLESYTPIAVDLVNGDGVTCNDVLPRNISQVDFLSSILKLFNLYVYEDSANKKKIYIKPYVDFFDLNVSGVVDWNYKLDRSKPIRLKPMSELNARFYNFKFKKDSDYYNALYFSGHNESYGDYEYDSFYKFINDKTDIEVIFSPSVLVGYTGEDKVVPALFKKNSGVEERMDTNIRILQTKLITGVTSWDIKDGATVLLSGTDYGYGGHYDDPDAPANDIHFGVPSELYFTLATGSISTTQFNVYWSSYMAEITDKDSKLLTGFFKLTAADIFKLDFSKLIYCEGSYWRLNKIEDWNASQPDVCKVELLKVINTIY